MAAWTVCIAVVAVLCAIEAAVVAAESGLFGAGRWRLLTVSYGGFWNGLLSDWQPNYPAQPILMFGTYALLHADPWHLFGNAAMLLYLGPALAGRIGTGPMTLALAMAVPGGAAAFALLSQSAAPMVGASGAVFGLVGAWVRADLALLRRRRRSARPVLWAVIALAALNAAGWWILEGHLAWQTHLGGFVAGWAVLAVLLRRRP